METMVIRKQLASIALPIAPCVSNCMSVYIYVKNGLQFETNGVADGASHTNTRIINSSVVWLFGRTHPWTFVGRPSDHGCIAIIIDAGQNFFFGIRRRAVYHCIKKN
jgi:hypothetical protein